MRHRHALLATLVVGVGLVILTPLTWAALLHWALIALTVGAGAVLAVYLLPYARRAYALLTPADAS